MNFTLNSSPAAGGPSTEAHRLAALQGYGIFGTDPEQAFDDLALLATEVCETPMAMVSFVGSESQCAKAVVGPLIARMPRSMSFCEHAIAAPGAFMEVSDATQDPRFSDNAQVGGDDGIRFYAAAPIVSPGGHALGTVCVLDRQPRSLSDGQRLGLLALARVAMDQLEKRRLASLVEQHGILDAESIVGTPKALARRLDEEWQRHARRGDSLGLLLIDMPPPARPMPTIHNIPVALLETVQGCLRNSDYLARLDDQWLAAVLPTSGTDASMLVAQRIRQALDKAGASISGRPVRLGVASMIPKRSAQPEQLVERVLHALSHTSAEGPSRVETFLRV